MRNESKGYKGYLESIIRVFYVGNETKDVVEGEEKKGFVPEEEDAFGFPFSSLPHKSNMIYDGS